MVPYRAKNLPFPGTRYGEIAPWARKLLRKIARRTKRHAYIRAAYWHKEKVFLTHFWKHTAQRSRYQQAARLKYLLCAIELIEKSHHIPSSKENVDRRSEILHRFEGLAPNGRTFFVQIKEDKRTNRKELMSVFPK